MCRFCLKRRYIPPIFVLNHYFLPKNHKFYTPWTVGSIGEKIKFIDSRVNKKKRKFAKRRGPKNAGTVWSWGRPSSW